MPVQFAFAREQLAQHLADAGGTWGGPPDPLAGPAPATVPSVLWNLSSPAERAALLADAGAEAPSQASPPPQPASGIDTSTIHHPYYRALSDANGGFWKHDPEGGVAVENHWMEVGTDIDGGTIYRMLTDYDVYGPGANNAFPPMNQDALLAMLAPRDALAWPKDPPATTNDARSAAAPRATTPAGQTGAAPPGSAAPPGTGDAEDIVVTARRTPVLHSPFHPLPPHHVARRLDPQGPLVQPPLQPAAAAATPPEAADAEAAPSGLPPLPTEARENPYDLLTIAIWEAQYDAAWRAANADGLRYDPVRDAEVREGFRQWRAETEARNAQLTAFQLEPLRTVIPPLDLAMSVHAVATGKADVWDWLTVGGSTLGAAGAGIRHLGAAARHIPTIGGRYPINAGWAGQVHPSGVRFNDQGFPDFVPFAKYGVQLQNLTGIRKIDIKRANEAVGLARTPPGYTWHHVEDGVTMLLVPTRIHKATPPTGGSTVIRSGGFDK